MSFRSQGYQEPPERTFELLEEGDYRFVVIECSDIEETDNGQEKLTVVLSVEEQKIYCFLYEGISKKGKPFDMISPFLKAIGHAPTASQAANPRYWASLVGKKGMAHIKQEEQVGGKYAGQLNNKVAFFIFPDSKATTRPTATATRAAAAPAAKPAIGRDPDLDVEPDDIPF